MARLADFGIARILDTTGVTATGLRFGTPAYLAPEQVEGSATSGATDVYALGLVLAECLTGSKAFEGTPSEIATARLHRGPELPPALGPEWIELLSAMTARSCQDRPSAAAVAGILAALAVRLDAPAPRTAAIGGDDGFRATSDTEVAVAHRERETTERALQRAPVPTEVVAVPALYTTEPASHIAAGTTKVALASSLVLAAGADSAGDAAANLDHEQSRPWSSRLSPLVVGLGVLLLVLGLLGGFGLSRLDTSSVLPAGTGRQLQPTRLSRHRATPTANSRATATKTSTARPTTSTTAPPATLVASRLSVPLAPGELVSGLTRLKDVGDISDQAAQALFNQLQPVLFAPSGPGPTAGSLAKSYDQLVQTFDQAVISGAITGPSAVDVLSEDLDRLASAFGVRDAPVTPVTTGSAGGGAPPAKQPKQPKQPKHGRRAADDPPGSGHRPGTPPCLALVEPSSRGATASVAWLGWAAEARGRPYRTLCPVRVGEGGSEPGRGQQRGER